MTLFLFIHDDEQREKLPKHCIFFNRKGYNPALCPGNYKQTVALLFAPKSNGTMHKQPFIDRSILIPIVISVFSLLGIFIALIIVYLDKPQAVASAGETATPFKYIFLGTETSVPDPELETTPTPTEETAPEETAPEETFPEETVPEETVPEEPAAPILIQTPAGASPVLPVPATPPISPASTLVSNTPQGPQGSTGPPITDTNLLTVIDRYDDIDPSLEYDGDWVNQSNVGNAYQTTLSVSDVVGSDVIFSFVGQQIIIGYLSQPNLGSIAISIDDDEFQVNQAVGREWVSPQFANTEHFVIIIHESGASVNLDYINILGSN